MCVLVTQSCPTLCDPMDCSLPGFSVHGILQARILEWIALPFSRGTSQPRDRTLVAQGVFSQLEVFPSLNCCLFADSHPALCNPMGCTRLPCPSLFPRVGTSGKESACQMQETQRNGFDPWLGRSLGGGNGNPLHYFCLENSMDREAWQATVHGVTKSQT